LGERHVEPLPEIGDAALRFLISLLAGVEGLLQRGELAPERRDLLVEHLDLRQRTRSDPPLCVELAAELGLALGVAADAVIEALVAVTLALGRRQARSQHRELLLETELAGLLQRQELGQLRDLRVKAVERGVFTGDLLRQIKLHEDEDGQQEDDPENQRRQCVDESGPVVHAAVAASACKSHPT
jgi:hypothetical protein